MLEPGAKADTIGVLLGVGGIALAILLSGAIDSNEPKPTPTPRAVIRYADPTPTIHYVRIPAPTAVPLAVLPTATPTPNQYADAPCGCSYDSYSCEDFNSQEGAQLCFNYCLDLLNEDVHQLVTDNPNDAYVWDGFACKERK